MHSIRCFGKENSSDALYNLYVDNSTSSKLNIETTIHLLKKLSWPHKGSYKEKLPENTSLPLAFYQNVYWVNTLAIIANSIYKAAQDKCFYNYLMAIAYESESFIWMQPGIIQSYYDKGIPWIAGTKENPSIGKNFPAISSAAGDVLILALIINNLHPEVGLWVAQEQQTVTLMLLRQRRWIQLH